MQGLVRFARDHGETTDFSLDGGQSLRLLRVHAGVGGG